MLLLFHDNFILIEATSSHFFRVTTSTKQLLFRVSYFFFFFFFSIRIFFHGHWRPTGQQEKGGDHFLFHSTTSIRSRTFRHLCSTLRVRWLSQIFNRNAYIYQTVTRWDLPSYRITIWLIDVVKLVFVCLLDDFISGFCYSNLDKGYQWTRSLIDYHPCITSEPTNQVS